MLHLRRLAVLSSVLVASLAQPLLAGTLTGRVVSSSGVGIADCDVDFSNGVNPANNRTAADGSFSIVVPNGTYDLSFLPRTSHVAREMLDVVIGNTTNLGDIVLQAGHVLSGTVLTGGLPVVNGNIDVYVQATGASIFTPGDTTGLTGNFAVMVPAGALRVRVRPPVGALLVAIERENVAVAGPTSLGTIALAPGVLLTGTVIDQTSAAPLAGVDVDVDDASTGLRITTPNDDTNALGAFAVVVPTGRFDLSFDPPATSIYAGGQRLGVVVSGATSTGAIGLARGLALTGLLLDAQGAPVAGGDINVYDELSGVKLFTPRDGTDVNGAFRVLVPAGSYRVRLSPAEGVLLVASELRNLAVSSALALGATRLAPGVLLRGTVVDDGTGAPLAGVDIDVEDAAYGREIPTPRDVTSATGAFALVVPSFLQHLTFEPPVGGLVFGLQRFDLAPGAGLDLGVVRLPRGFALSGRVRDAQGLAVVGAEIEVRTQPESFDGYVPHATTDANGDFRVIAPAGSHPVNVKAPRGAALAGKRLAPVALSGALALPPIDLAPGIELTGRVRAHDLAPEAFADLRLRRAGTQELAVLTSARTAADGTYRLFAEAGTWDLEVQPNVFSLSRAGQSGGIALAAPTVRDLTLSLVPVAAYCAPLGVPVIAQGGVVTPFLAFLNPSALPQPSLLSLVLMLPDGSELPLLAGLPITWPPFALLGDFLPLPVPPIAPALVGRALRYELRLADPTSGAIFEREGFSFFVR